MGISYLIFSSEFQSKNTIEKCSKNIDTLEGHIKEISRTNQNRLQEEYEKLVENLRRAEEERAEDRAWANPVLPDAILQEAVPGSIRTSEHFMTFMRRIIEYLKHRMRTRAVLIESPASFLRDIKSRMFIDRKPMRYYLFYNLYKYSLKLIKLKFRFCAERFSSLSKTLELADISDFGPLVKLTNFATIISTYSVGFSVIFEPSDVGSFIGKERNCTLYLNCMDASIAIRPVLDRFQTVIITSGVLTSYI